MFHIDFKRGALVPLAKTDLLPVGSVVSYSDMANPRKLFVVTGATVGEYSHGQECICEDGHRSTVHASDPDRHGRGNAGWQFARDRETGEPQILNATALSMFVADAKAEGERLAAKRKEDEANKKRAAIVERAEIIAQYPYLEQAGQSKRRGYALASFNLKKLLAREFPGVAFSVKSSSFSMGNSVDVSWTDGPTHDEVDKIADRFQNCDFDGMQDLSTYRDTVWPEVFGGAKYVHCQRSISDAKHVEIAKELGYVVTVGLYSSIEGVDVDTKEMIYRECRNRSYFTK